MSTIVEQTEKDLAALGVLEGAVTSDYIENDVRNAMKAAHIEKADLQVTETEGLIKVQVTCRNKEGLKAAGDNVVKHLGSEQVKVQNVSFSEVGDGLWRLTFDVVPSEPVH
jgi:hypothetical protein